MSAGFSSENPAFHPSLTASRQSSCYPLYLAFVYIPCRSLAVHLSRFGANHDIPNATPDFPAAMLQHLHSCFAIVPAQAQEAPTQETHGINVANMDRSREAGRRLLPVLQRRLDQAHRNSARPRSASAYFPQLDDVSQQAHRRHRLKKPPRATPPPDQASARLPTSTTPTWTRRRLKQRAWRRCSRISKAIAAITDKQRTGPRAGRNAARRCGRAEQHEFPHANLLDCGSRPASTTPSTTPPICCKAACNCPTANITWRTTST